MSAELDLTAAMVSSLGLACTAAEVSELADVRAWSMTLGADFDATLIDCAMIQPASRQLSWGRAACSVSPGDASAAMADRPEADA